MIIIVGTYVFSQRYTDLKDLNVFDPNETNWEAVLNELGIDPAVEISSPRALNQALGSALRKRDKNFSINTVSVKMINLQDALRSKKYTLFDLKVKPRIPEARFLSLFGLLKDPLNSSRIKQIMARYSVSKENKILIFCDSGFSSKVGALILAFHGYDASYGRLIDVNDPRYLLSPYKKGKVQNNIFFKRFNMQEAIERKDVCIFIVFGEREGSISKFLMPSYKRHRDSIEGNTAALAKKTFSELGKRKLLKVIKASPEVEVKNPLLKKHLVEEITNADLGKAKIICFGKMHAFITALFLDYRNATDVKTLYVVNPRR